MHTAQRFHPLIATWRSMKWRCTNPNRSDYKRYGALGVKVCDRWMTDFWAFVEDMGPKPTARHTLDRIRSEGDYEPDNCRWATPSEQAANRRAKENATRLVLNGRVLLISEWAEATGISKWVIRARITSLGWTPERALTTPVRAKARAYQ